MHAKTRLLLIVPLLGASLLLPSWVGCNGPATSKEATTDDDDGERKRKKKKRAADDDAEAPPKPLPTTPPPTPVPPPAPLPAAAPPPVAAFTAVDSNIWMPRLGPKMRQGSKAAHTVFEGPFGPSPKTLFAVLEYSNQQFFALLMGDDGKGWPAGPLHDDQLMAMKVLAVSFFDADGDGTTDALVVMRVHDSRGNETTRSALLRWTPLGMRRLLKLEPKIQGMGSAEAIRRKLQRL